MRAGIQICMALLVGTAIWTLLGPKRPILESKPLCVEKFSDFRSVRVFSSPQRPGDAVRIEIRAAVACKSRPLLAFDLSDVRLVIEEVPKNPPRKFRPRGPRVQTFRSPTGALKLGHALFMGKTLEGPVLVDLRLGVIRSRAGTDLF